MEAKDKDVYIKKADAAEALAKAFTEVPMPVALAEGILDSVPTLDLTEILEESEICGYNFKELLMFAEACQMQGITKDDLKDFCMNAESAAQYVIDKIEECEKDMAGDLMMAKAVTVPDDIIPEG